MRYHCPDHGPIPKGARCYSCDGPTRRDWVNQTHMGDCRDLMRQMIADGVKVQCIVTSPPYWGLRDYGVAGQFGLERTWIRHVARMRGVFRLARELLTEDGLLWMNYGDSYYSPRVTGSVGVNSTINGKESHAAFRDAQRARGKQPSNQGSINTAAVNRRFGQPGLKPKDLVGMPWRVAFALQHDGWYLRSDVIWHKPNPMPESIADRPTKSHEYVFLLSKSELYQYDAEAVKEPVTGNSHSRGNGMYAKVYGWAEGPGSHDVIDHNRRNKQNTRFASSVRHVMTSPKISDSRKPLRSEIESRHRSSIPGGQSLQAEPDGWRNARTVWTIPTEGFSGAHFATFPQDLVARCILAGSRPGDTILDMFHGSGTVGKVATDLGRKFIGCELNPEYIKLNELRRTTTGMPI